MYGSLMGAYAIEMLKQDKKNRIVAIKNDVLTDYEISEGLAINNNELDNFQYELSLRLAE
jgi:6-phosphofructokinase 1